MAYLTVSEYVSRFGDRETILLTNDTAPAAGATRTYDGVKIERAIADAGEVVEGYVGRRYVTPIDSPPNIVKGWVAALAREALHTNTNKITEAVKAAADRARGQLADLVAGRLNLPIEEGTDAPASVSTGEAVSSRDREGPVFTGGALDRFTAPFTGYSYSPAWRNGR